MSRNQTDQQTDKSIEIKVEFDSGQDSKSSGIKEEGSSAE